jgi:N-acyl-D-aspartate/D-glutamate deacylase
MVTPGFIDIHAHYDGQAPWENGMQPSSSHGVTTVVIGSDWNGLVVAAVIY